MKQLRSMIKELYKIKEKELADQVLPATAFRAFGLHSTCNGWQESLRAFINNLEGKIDSLAWEIVPKGVLEITAIKFPDESKLQMTRFINSAGESISLQLKKVD